MKKFAIGDNFSDINDYATYPYSHLFFHGNLVGKAITDNWQYRMIYNNILNGSLKKAKLNDGLFFYRINISCPYIDFHEETQLSWYYKIIAESEVQAKELAVKKLKKEGITKAELELVKLDVEVIKCS